MLDAAAALPAAALLALVVLAAAVLAVLLPAAVLPAGVAAGALAAAGVAACTPMVCSSVCNIRANRFCCVLGVTGVMASPSESLVLDSTVELFLCPCEWAVREDSAEGAELKLAMDDIGASLI